MGNTISWGKGLPMKNNAIYGFDQCTNNALKAVLSHAKPLLALYKTFWTPL